MRNEKKQISPSRPCFLALIVCEEKESFLTTTVGQRVYIDVSSSSSSFSSLCNKNNSARKSKAFAKIHTPWLVLIGGTFDLAALNDGN